LAGATSVSSSRRCIGDLAMKLDIINAGVTYDVLQRAVPIHPTVSELIPTLLSEMKRAE
jgi:hypothetical protein